MRRAALVAAVLAACGDNTEQQPDAMIDPAAQFDDTAAWIEVRTYAPPGGDASTGVSGHIITDPELWPYGEASREGSCRMWTRTIELCDPFCEWTETCVNGTCLSSPPSRSAGTLTVGGGGTTRMLPFQNGAYELFTQERLFDAGTEITVSAPGDVVGAFTMSAVMPRAFELDGLTKNRAVATMGQPLELRWTPGDPGSRVRIVLGADLGHAQHRPVVVECDLPDEAGGVLIPQGMVDELADTTHWACGICIGQTATRYRRARTMAGALPLSLWVVQPFYFDLRPGLP